MLFFKKYFKIGETFSQSEWNHIWKPGILFVKSESLILLVGEDSHWGSEEICRASFPCTFTYNLTVKVTFSSSTLLKRRIGNPFSGMKSGQNLILVD